jgi:hypothetical protein
MPLERSETTSDKTEMMDAKPSPSGAGGDYKLDEGLRTPLIRSVGSAANYSNRGKAKASSGLQFRRGLSALKPITPAAN